MASKYDLWVPHQPSPENLIDRVSICVSLRARQKKEPFLDRIVTGDEKWVLYKNVQRKRSWSNRGQTPLSAPKDGSHPKKLMLCVWWDSKIIVYFELLQPNETVTAELYCERFERLR